jgi:hypothetical protein
MLGGNKMFPSKVGQTFASGLVGSLTTEVISAQDL